MKIKKLRTKLIGINCLLLIVILLSQYLFQNIFLEKYYKNYKKDQIINSLKEYEKLNEKDEITKYQKELSKNQSITIFEIDKNFENIIDSTLVNDYIVIRDKNGEERKVQILVSEEVFEDIELGDDISVKAIKSNISEMPLAIKVSIYRNGKAILKSNEVELVTSIEDSSGEGNVLEELETEEINGVLIDYKKSENNINKHNQIVRYYASTNNIKIENESLEDITYGGEPYTIGIRKSENGYITAIASVKISKDIADMFNKFNRYLILMAIILIGGLLILYEKVVTKPIIKINEASKEIANENFNIKLNVETGNELEELAKSVQEISENLNKSMEELKIANNQLEVEYNERIQIEKNQKNLLMNISHDLKTPLTVVKGNLQAMKDGVYDIDSSIDSTIDSVDEVGKTLNEMLELTKLKSSSFKLNLEICDISRIVYKTYDRLKNLSKDKNIKVEFEMETDTFVNVDQREMQKVIENLMVNGINYSPENEKIYIKLKELGENYIFTLENTGVNIDKSELDLLFTEFYRRDKSRGLYKGGNGLGLTIVKTILESHKLNYDIRNTNRGILFEIEFPLINL
ncbi:HAMP domain-containing sensor histidine kinase [Clostridium sp. UBA1056]|uniref:HAMP domain-containing sensor histidine kinase n=1 Tax=unclassified Clostridium TaxID=2614128 RepID=UPI003217CA8B